VSAVASPVWEAWSAARPTSQVLHLDSAASGRSSSATLRAVADHARLEAETGCYVAQERAGGLLDTLRTDIAGLLGTDADGVAFVEGAETALALLLDAWPFPEGARVGVAAGEWGPNLESFAHRGLTVLPLEVDADGVLDLPALQRRLASDPPTLVHLVHVAAHRALVQPVAAAATVCRAAGVPVWVDAAQALGHVDTTSGTDAVYATSRKWLTGPRGVGMIAVAPPYRDRLRVRRRARHPGLPTVGYLESAEAHVAGRVGLAVAVREYLALGPHDVAVRLDQVGDLTRQVLVGTEGWEIVGPEVASGATTGLRATNGQDVTGVRSRLLTEHGILTTACLPWRAPREMGEPLLRVSPHVDCTVADIERLRAALESR